MASTGSSTICGIVAISEVVNAPDSARKVHCDAYVALDSSFDADCLTALIRYWPPWPEPTPTEGIYLIRGKFTFPREKDLRDRYKLDIEASEVRLN
jgi:hypothetical protein